MKLSPLLFLILAQTAAAQTISELHVGQSTVAAEVANSKADRERGLMGRDTLAENAAMVFVFPNSDRYSFWMANTPLPLSIAFIDEAGVVINIEDMAANSETIHSAKRPARYALEMKQGWFASHRVRAGDRISGLSALPKARD